MAGSVKRRGELELVVVNGKKAEKELLKVQKANQKVGAESKKTTKAGVEQTKGTSLLTGSMTGLVKSLGAAAAAYISLEGAQKLMQWGEEAAKVRDLTSAFEGFNKTAGISAPRALGELRTAVQGTIADVELMQRSNLLMMLDVPMDRVGDIAKIAKNAALATGQDVSYMLESLSVALARQSKLWLDNLGIIVDADKAKAAYAKQVGKTVSALTEEERKLAFVNAALDAGLDTIERSGGLLTGAADPYARLNASAKNLSVTMKELLIPATSAFADALSINIVHMDKLIDKATSFWSDPSFAKMIQAAFKLAELAPGDIPGVTKGGTRRPANLGIENLGGGRSQAERGDAENRRSRREAVTRLAIQLDKLEARAEDARMKSSPEGMGVDENGAIAELLAFEQIDLSESLENLAQGFDTFAEFLEHRDAMGESAGGVYALGNAFEYLGSQAQLSSSLITESLGLATTVVDGLRDAYADLALGNKKAFPQAMALIAKDAQARIAAIGAVAAIDAAKYAYKATAEVGKALGGDVLAMGRAQAYGMAAAQAAGVAVLAGAGTVAVGSMINSFASSASAGNDQSAEGTDGSAGEGSSGGDRSNNINVTRTAPTTITIAHNYHAPVYYSSQTASDAVSVQEALDGGDILISEQEVA
jgi:hypothetical protein